MKRTHHPEIASQFISPFICVLILAAGVMSGPALAQTAPAETAGQAAPPAAGAPVEVEAGAGQAEALAKQLSNPISSLISVPFQANWEFGVGPDNDTRFVLNVQPVMPFSLNKDWNLIERIIMPYLSQPSLVPGSSPTSGLGDFVWSSFFSPVKPTKGGWIWGAGPVFSLPVSADPALGSEKWGIGPTFVVLKQSGPWTYGMLANQIWSFAGEEDRADVNQTFLQPFLAHTTKQAVTFTLQSESTANWEAGSGGKWSVPINFLVSKVLRLGRSPISVQGGAGYYVESPSGGPEWKIRTAITLLFPAR
jgi:hypothetical protein